MRHSKTVAVWNALVAGATETDGAAIDTDLYCRASFQLTTTGGTTNGTLKVQYSNDIPPSTFPVTSWTPTNWSDLEVNGMLVSKTFTAAGTGGLHVPIFCARWLRAVWTTGVAANTITLNAQLNG